MTLREEIMEEMEAHGESFEDVVGCTLTPEQLDVRFNNGWGSSAGSAFTLWTTNRVYFPAVYDGAEWCASVPRNVCGEATEHVGGQ